MTSVLWSGLNSPGKEEAHTQVPTPGCGWFGGSCSWVGPPGAEGSEADQGGRCCEPGRVRRE